MAFIDRLTVKGFKSIQVLEDFELYGLNVLIGANGAGKSNLLSLFRMLEHLAVKRLQLFVKEQGGPDLLLFGGRKRTTDISADLVFGKGKCRYRFSLEPTSGDMTAFANEWVLPEVPESIERVAPGAFPTVNGGTSWTGGYEEARVADCRAGDFASYVLPEMQRWRVFHFQDASRLANVRQPSAVRDNLRLKEDAGNLAPFLRRLRERHPAEYRRVVEAVRIAAPFFGDFVYREDRDMDGRMELEWFHASDPDTVLGQRHISDGMLRFVCLATLLLQPIELQPTVILIDEPELGLHPAALTVLAEILQSTSDERQVIVATQSADLVSDLDPEQVVVVDRKEEASVFRRLDKDTLRDWLKDYALGELWKMNVLGGRPG